MKFAFNECHEAVAGLWHSLDCHWMNNPARDDIGHRKAYQLKVARETGLDIPDPVGPHLNDANACVTIHG